MNTKLYPKAKEFLAAKPTLICTVAGVRFYEHPVYGDEYPLVAIVGGKKKTTSFLEVPTLDEVLDFVASI